MDEFLVNREGASSLNYLIETPFQTRIIELLITNVEVSPCELIYVSSSVWQCFINWTSSCLAASLRQKYFEKHIKLLHTLDLHSWWSKIRHFLHPANSDPLRCLQDSDSEDLTLAESISDFCQHIGSLVPPWFWHVFKPRLRLDTQFYHRPCQCWCASCNN